MKKRKQHDRKSHSIQNLLRSGIFILFLVLLYPTMGLSQNYAVQFDGTNDYIGIPNSSEWDFGTGNFTIAFWVTFGDLNHVHDGLFGREDFQWLAMEYNHDGDHRLNLWIDSNGSYYWEFNNLKPAKDDWLANTWYHIAVVRDNNMVKIFIDGVESASSAYTNTVYNPSGPLYFGRSQLSNRIHIGLIDDIRIYHAALSEIELQAEIYNDLIGNELNLAGYWNMNQSSGITINDGSVHGNDGTLYYDATMVSSGSPVLTGSGSLSPFSPVLPTGLPYSVIISQSTIDGQAFPEGTSIALYDNNLCVGAAEYDPTSNTQVIAWKADASQGLAGFTQGDSIHFKVRMEWFSTIEIFDATATFAQGDGTFGNGNFTVVNLNINSGLTPNISASTNQLNFDAVPINTTVSDTIVLTNTGTATLSILNLSSSNAVFSASLASNQIPAGENDSIFVSFTPTQIVTYSENLTLITDDPVQDTLVFNMYGMGLPVPQSNLVLSPANLNFGNINPGDTAWLSFSIANQGNGLLTINSISSNSSEFFYSGSGSFNLIQNESQELEVAFVPTGQGPTSGQINISTSEGDASLVLFGIAGSGHFQQGMPTGQPYTIIAQNTSIDNLQAPAGTEIAVFDDTNCVGVGYISSGSSAYFDGNDYISAPLDVSETAYTAEMWFKSYSPSGGIYSVVGGGHDRHIYLNNGNIYVRLYSSEVIHTSGTNYSDGNWHHVAHVYGGTVGGQRIYVDGILKASGSKSNSDFNWQTDINIGYSADWGYFNGLIDEIRVWNKALSQSEIQQFMYNAYLTTNPDLAFNLNFIGNTATDVAGNNIPVYLYDVSLTEDSPFPEQNTLITVWQADPSIPLPGFTPGNNMSFKLWTNLFDTDIELDASPDYLIGDSTFGYSPFTVVNLSANSGLDPVLEFSSQYLYVGQVQVGQSVSDSIFIYNYGNVPVHVDLSLNSTAFSLSGSSFILQVGDTVPLGITFTPQSPGNNNVQITVTSNDPDVLQTEIQLEGFALPAGSPNIGLSNYNLSFNGVLIDSSKTMELTIINTGTSSLQITNITSSNGLFTASPSSFTLPNTNDNQIIQVTFSPTDKGFENATLTLQSNTSSQSFYATGVAYEGIFSSVPETGNPYTIVIENTNLAANLQVGDEIGVFDNGLCVGSSPIMPNGNSLSLDGSGDYMQVDETSLFDLQDFTFSAWINYKGGSGWKTIFDIDNDEQLFAVVSGTLTIYGRCGNHGFATVTQGWHHVAWAVSGNTYFVYLDGVLVGSATTCSNGVNADHFMIGSGYYNNEVFYGDIDEASVWNYARTQQEIQNDMYHELNGNESGLLAYWNFNGTTYDSGPHHFTSSLAGNANTSGPQSSGIISNNIQITVWEEDLAQGLAGYTPGDTMEYKVALDINGFPSILNASASYSFGDGTFGFGMYSACSLNFMTPTIDVQPSSLFTALNEPDSITEQLFISNTGDEELYYLLSPDENPYDKSLHLDGSGDYVNTGSWTAGTQWTIQAWVKPSSLPGGRHSIFGGFGSCHDWGITLQDGHYGIAIRPGSCSATYSDPQAAISNEWALVTGTCDGTTARIFVNGVLVNSGPVAPNYAGVNTSIRIGGEACCGSNNFPGLLDEVSVWNYPLTQAEILQYASNSLLGTEPGLLGYWNFNDGSLTDLSGNGHNGSFAGNSFVAEPGPPMIANWLDFSSLGGTLLPGATDTIQIEFKSSGLIDGLYEQYISIFSNDFNTPIFSLPVQLNVTGNAQIAVSHDSLSFGQLIVGESDTLSFDIENIGTDYLHFDSINLPDPVLSGFSIIGSVNLPDSIAPLQSYTVDVLFAPTINGSLSDSLILVSDASNNDSITVYFDGTGLTPADISVSTFNWSGTLVSGSSIVDSFYIANNGQADLIFTLNNFVPWLSLNPTNGTVGVNDSIMIDMNISAFGVYAGVYPGTFEIASNDLNNPSLPFSVELTVTGTPDLYTDGAYNFGTVNVGDVGLYQLPLVNIGTDSLHIDSILIDDPVFSFSGPTSNTIPPGESDTLTLLFIPGADYNYSGILSIYSDASSSNLITTALYGDGNLPPDISVPFDTIQVSTNFNVPYLYSGNVSNVGGENLNLTANLDPASGNALSLDGNGDYLNVVNSVSLNPDSAITVEAWIKLDDNHQEFIVAKEYSSIGTYRLFVNSSSQLAFQLNNSKIVHSTATIPTGTWIHVAGSSDGKKLQVFINGVLSGESVYAPFSISTNTFNLRVGRSYFNEYFDGKMDELRIWGVYKNASEIMALMNQSLHGNEFGLVLYYTFDAGNSNIAIDESGNNNNGTFYGNTTRTGSTLVLNDFVNVSLGNSIVAPSLSTNLLLNFDGNGMQAGIYERTLHILSNDPDEAELIIPVIFEVTGTSTLSYEPLSLDFNDTYIGLKDTIELFLQNEGPEPLSISNLEFTNGDFSLEFDWPVIYPYSSKQFEVYFIPQSQGSYTDTFSITNNSTNLPNAEIPITASGLEPPLISLSGSNFSDTLDYGNTSTQQLILYNNGNGPMNWNIDGYNPQWLSLSEDTGVVAAHDSLIVTLTFNGTNNGGNYQSVLNVHSNDYTNPMLNITASLWINGASLSLPTPSFSDYVTYQELAYDSLIIQNTGIGPLNYTLSESLAWLSLSQTSGSVAPGSVDTVLVTYDGDNPFGTYQGLVQLTTNDPFNPNVDLDFSLYILQATLATIPGTLNFGYAVVNIGETQNLTILNNGNVDLTIDSIYSVDPFSPNTMANTFLAAGQSIQVPVFFLPNATLIYNETIYIATDIGLFTVPVHGTGENPYADWSYSWDHWDYGLVDVAVGATKNLTIYNTGNIPFVMDDFDVSESHFTVSDSIFTLNPGQSKTVTVYFNPTAIAIYEATMLWTSNSIGTKEILLDGRGFFLSQAPILTYVDDNNYNGTDGVSPLIGSSTQVFEYKVVYTDADNNSPMQGYPIVGIDKNGDGDFLDIGEDEFEMSELDNTDSDFTDGKEYTFSTTLPLNFDLGYSFYAYDSLGNPPIGEATAYRSDPLVSNDFLDLSIFANDIVFSDNSPAVGQNISISATVHNNSDYPASNVSVRFYEEDSFITELVIPYLAGQSSSTVLIYHSFPIDEYYPIKVVVDEENYILEDNELNNFAIRPVLVGEFAIPGAIVATAYVTPTSVVPYGTVHWYGHADYVNSYDPNANVSGAQVTMTINQTGYTYTTYTNANGDFSIYFPAPSTVGTYTISGEVTDFTLLANTNNTSFTVYIPQETEPIIGPDLAITYWWGTDIHWTSECRRIGDPIDVTAYVSNIGNATAYEVLVHVFQDNNLIMTPIFDSIPAGTNKVITFTVTYNTVAYHSVSVDIDPYDAIAELNEWNNYGSKTRWIYPLEPDLAPVYAWASDASPLQGQAVNFTFKIDNLECTTSDTTHADFYHIFGTDTTFIESQTVDQICANCYDYLYLYNLSYTDVGWHKIRIVVDPENTVYETNEGNNILEYSFYVELAVAELTISNISFSAYNPDPGDLINFTATIWNNGTADASDFYVHFYMDNNLIGDSIWVNYLPAGVNLLVTSDPWEVTECGHTVFAYVDKGNFVPEYNEYNNSTNRPVGYDFVPSLWPYYYTNHISVLVGSTVTLKSRIYNNGTLDGDTVFVSYVINNNMIGFDGIPHIEHQGFSSSNIIYSFPYTGDYEVKIYADRIWPDSVRFCELDESNNVVSLFVHVYGEDPDLEVLSQHISPTELNPDPGEVIDIFGSFTNNGNVPAGPFYIKFYANSVQLGDSVFVTGIGAHEDSTVACTASFSSPLIGTHVIRMEVDALHQVVEYNELNNLASRAIIVGDAPDHTFSDAGAGIWLSDTFPSPGDTITINGIVENNGGATGTALLNYYYIYQGDSTLIESVSFTAAPYDSLDFPIQWVVQVPYGRIFAKITNASPEEFNIFNNQTHIDFGQALDPINPNLTGGPTIICLGDTVNLDVDPTGGIGSYIITWSSNPPGFYASGMSITDIPSATTTYTCTVSDGFTSAQASITVQVVDLNVDLGPDLIFCNNGTAVLDAGNFDMYNWSTGETSQTITISDNGDYWVEVSSSNTGCSASDTVHVDYQPGPQGVHDIFIACNTGPATYHTSHTGPLTFLWEDGSTADSIVLNMPGTYYATITDEFGCSSTDTIDFSYNIIPLDLGPDIVTCTGTVITLDAGSGYQYYWSTGEVSSTINVGAGTYYVMKFGSSNCTASDTITITYIPELPVDLGTDTELCPGDSLVLDAGNYNAQVWNDQSQGSQLLVSSAGTYSVTVYDQYGCSGSDSINVSVPNLPVIDIPDAVLCLGETFGYTINGATDVVWSNGTYDSTISLSQSGLYSVTAWFGSCSVSDTFNLSFIDLNLELGPDTIICEGDSFIADAGANYLNYYWSTGESTQQITLSDAGWYYVTVGGQGQCTANDSVLLTVEAIPQALLDSLSYICPNSSLTLDPGQFDFYLWNNQSTLSTLSVSQPGIYTVTVSTAAGCSNSASTVVLEDTLPPVNLGPDINICEGSQYNLNAGIFASYIWNNQSTNQYLTVWQEGDYWVDVVNEHGCTSSDGISVTVLPISLNLGTDIHLCTGNTATISAGTYASYNWSTGASSQDIIVNTGGLYSLTVSASNGCSASDSILVIIETPPQLELGPDIWLCPGEISSLSSDFAAYYIWSTGSTDQTITLSDNGIYAVTVGNNYQCEVSDSIEVFFYPETPVSFTGLANSYCANDSDVQLSGIPAGGQFSGNGVIAGNFYPQYLNPGTYSVYYSYTDTNNCQFTSSQNTVVYPLPDVFFTGLLEEYYSDGETDTLIGLPTGGTFSGPGMNANVFDPTLAGVGQHEITYAYTDSNSCTGTYSDWTLVSTVYNVYGQLVYANANGSPVQGVSSFLTNEYGTHLDTSITNTSGDFTFYHYHSGQYLLAFEYTGEAGGINATDALKIRRHVVFLESLSGINLEAADVNSSNTVSSADALLVLRRTVGYIPTFPAGDFVFTSPQVNITGADIYVYVEMLSNGDVNGSYTPSTAKSLYPGYSLNRNSKLLVKGQEDIRIPVSIKSSEVPGAVTCFLNYDSERIEITSVESAVDNFVYQLTDNQIRIACESINGIDPANGEATFILHARLLNENSGQVRFSISDETEIADIYGNVIQNAEIMIPELTMNPEDLDFSLEQNFPNPFRDETTIRFTLPEKAKVYLSIFDLTGHEIIVLRNETLDAGTYEVPFRKKSLSAGVYLYKLTLTGDTQSQTATGNMQIIK